MKILLLIVALVVAGCLELAGLRYVRSPTNERLTTAYRSPVGRNEYLIQKTAVTVGILALLVAAVSSIFLA